MAKDPEKRKSFVDSLVPYLQRFGFQGLDLDWEGPAFGEGSDPAVDKADFSLLVDEIKTAFEPEGLVLSLALLVLPEKADAAYDVPYIAERADFLNLMAYDYHGWWSGHEYTGMESPILSRPEEVNPAHPAYQRTVYSTLEYYINAGKSLITLLTIDQEWIKETIV